jgi:AcrR family transcriptional regulator
VTDTADDQKIEVDLDALPEGSWRRRVVLRSLGPAISESLERSTKFIAAASDLLELSGEDVAVQDVADRAGFSLRVLYRYFNSKEDLLAAVLEDQQENAARRLRRELSGIDDPVVRLRTYIRLTVGHERTKLNLAMVKTELILLFSHPEEVLRAHAPMVALAREIIQAAVASGRLAPQAAENGLYSMMALRRGYNRARLLGDDCGLPLPTDDAMTEYLMRGLGIVERPIRKRASPSEL